MRRYDIVSGILLILSIIDFALAAPVLVQEKRQGCVNVVHIPKDVMTVLGKRGTAEELEKLAEGFFKTGDPKTGNPIVSSAPPGPIHGPTNVEPAAGPNPASTTANPGDDKLYEVPLHGPGSQPNPNPGPSTDSAYDWIHPPSPRPASPKEIGQAHENQGEQVLEPIPGPPTLPPRPASSEPLNPASSEPSNPALSEPSNPESSTNSGSKWKNWKKLIPLKPASSKPPNPNPSTNSDSKVKKLVNSLKNYMDPASSKELGQAHKYQAEHVALPSPAPSADPNFDWNRWMKEVNHGDLPPPGPASPGPSSSNLKPSTNPGSKMKNMLHSFIDSMDPLPQRPASSKEFGQAEHVALPSPAPSADPNFDWNRWMKEVNHEGLPPPGPASSEPSNLKPSTNSAFNLKNLANAWMDFLDPLPKPAPSKPLNPKPLDAGSSGLTAGSSSAGSSSLPKLDSDHNSMVAQAMAAPRPLRIGSSPEDKPPSPASTDPVDHQSSSTDSQPELSPEDRQAALYAAKGKKKVHESTMTNEM